MIESSESVIVNCSVEEAFSYLDKPKNHQRFTPSLVQSQLITRFEDGKKVVEYTYSLFGIKFEGSLEEVEREVPHKIKFEMTGDITGEIVIRVSESESGTEIRYTGRYDLYASKKDVLTRGIGKALRPIASWYNKRELRRVVSNIKSDLES